MAAAGQNERLIIGNIVDKFIPIVKGKSIRVHLQILRGNITHADTEVIVIFRKPDGRASGDSLVVLEAAGQSGEDEYQHVKSKGGIYVNKGVVQTSTNNSDRPKYIFHLHVENNVPRFRQTVSTALRAADKLEAKTIAFPSLPDDIKSLMFVESVLEVFQQFTTVDRPLSLHFIQVIVMQSHGLLAQCESPRDYEEFEMYKNRAKKQEVDGMLLGGDCCIL